MFWILKDPVCASSNTVIAGRTLESEDMPVIFQEKVQKMLKKRQNMGKILAKMYKILRYFEPGQDCVGLSRAINCWKRSFLEENNLPHFWLFS